MTNTRSGRLITFEGLEGSGKSTNAKWAVHYLRECGVEVEQAHEPGGTDLANEIRDVLLAKREEKFSPITELFLMFASRAQLLSERIKPALAAGRWVVCDRYADSSIAYQGGGRELGTNHVKQLVGALGKTYVEPNLTILLDIVPRLIPERLAQRHAHIHQSLAQVRSSRVSQAELDRFESEDEEFFKRIRDAYESLAQEFGRIRKVDAQQPLEAVQQDLRTLLDNELRFWESC